MILSFFMIFIYINFIFLLYSILNEFEENYLRIKSENKEDFNDESIHQNLSTIGLYLLLIFIFLISNLYLIWKPFEIFKYFYGIKYFFIINICTVLGYLSLYPRKTNKNKEYLTIQNSTYFFLSYMIIKYLYF